MVVFINSEEEGACTFTVYILSFLLHPALHLLSPPAFLHPSHFFHLLSNHLLVCPTSLNTMSDGEMDAGDLVTSVS